MIKTAEKFNVYQPKELESFLKNEKLVLTKERGQNFLVNQDVLEKMASLVPNSLPILEIGPGMGHFTRYLAQRTPQFSAVEIDKGFYQYLKTVFNEQIELYHLDFLKFDFKKLNLEKITAVGNIPYSLSLPILLHLLRNISYLNEFFLLVQEEFAYKLLSNPGTENYGRISVLTQVYSKPEIVLKVPSSCFFPAPKVNSAFVRFSSLSNHYDRGFENFITGLFSARRKTFNNNLKSYITGAQIEQLFKDFSLNEKIRAENISPQTLSSVYQKIQANL